MDLQDPDVREFIILNVSETFSQILRCTRGVEYDERKLQNGMIELAALFGLELRIVEPKAEEKHDPEIGSEVCLAGCGRRLTKARRRFGYHHDCEAKVRNEMKLSIGKASNRRVELRSWLNGDFPILVHKESRGKKAS